MKVLLDESVPVQVRVALKDHETQTVTGIGWRGRENGDLLSAAEQAGFDVFVIADKNMRHQQNLANRRIAIVELWTNHRPTLEKHFPLIAAAVDGITPAKYVILSPH
jgi:hypothetical protein